MKEKTLEKLKGILRKKETFFLFLLLFGLIWLRFAAFGLEYQPQLDDYIQLHNYATSEDYLRFLSEQGLLSARPLAGVFDLYVWSNLWDNLFLAVTVISLMLSASVIFIKSVLEKYFALSPLFCVLIALVPAATEGTYWLAASTRIVVGLFFASLSFVLFQRFLENGRLADAIFFVPLQLISFGFYEQILVFSCAFCLFLFLLNVRKNTRRAFLAAVTLPDLVIYFSLCLLAGTSTLYGSRMELALPDNPYYFETFLPDVLVQIKAVFLNGNAVIFLKGFLRGLTSGVPFVIFLLLLLSASLFFFFGKGRKGEKMRNPFLGMLVGFLLAVFPVLIFFFIANTWFSFRCMVASLPGIALFFDSFTEWAFGKCRTAKKFLVCLFCFVCCTATLSEIADYRETAAFDESFGESLAAYCESIPGGKKIGILNVEPTYLTEQNFYYHEHIHGVTESQWALTGMMIARDTSFAHSLTPMPISQPYAAWNRDNNLPENFDLLLLYLPESNSFVPVEVVFENGLRALYDENGVKRAEITEENNVGKGRICSEIGEST